MLSQKYTPYQVVRYARDGLMGSIVTTAVAATIKDNINENVLKSYQQTNCFPTKVRYYTQQHLESDFPMFYHRPKIDRGLVLPLVYMQN